MDCAPIIPHSNGTYLPLPANVVIICGMDVVSEKVKESVGFFFLELCKTSHKAIVYVEGFESCNRMSSDSRVMGIDRRSVGRNTPKIENGIIWNRLVLNLSPDGLIIFLH